MFLRSGFALGTDVNGFAIADHIADVVAYGAWKKVSGGEISQRNPFGADLKTVGFGGLFSRSRVELAQENEVDLVAETFIATFGNAFIDAGHSNGRDAIAGFFQKLSLYGFGQHFAGALTAARQREIIAESGFAAIYQQPSFADYNRFC